jgi:hypothetical protein
MLIETPLPSVASFARNGSDRSLRWCSWVDGGRVELGKVWTVTGQRQNGARLGAWRLEPLVAVLNFLGFPLAVRVHRTRDSCKRCAGWVWPLSVLDASKRTLGFLWQLAHCSSSESQL